MVASKRSSCIGSVLFSIALSLGMILLGIVAVIPFIKYWNFLGYLHHLQRSEALRGATIVVGATYEGARNNLIAFNIHKPIHPGSNFKLFTTATSMALLGREWRFATRLWKFSDGEGKVHLLLEGGGDPTLRKGDLVELVQVVQKEGWIEGDLFYSDRIFEGERFGPGWDSALRDQYFSVPITGLFLEDNLLSIRGGWNEKEEFEQTTFPLERYESIRDERTFKEYGEELEEEVTAVMERDGTIVLRGDTMEGLPFRTSAVVRDPSRMAAFVLKQELNKVGLIAEEAHVVPFRRAKRGTLISEHLSQPLSDVITAMLTFSRNHYAEALVRTLGRVQRNRGTQEKGVEVLQEFTKNIGVLPKEFEAFDGSGLSPMTRVSASAILTLFDWIEGQPWKKDFWNALPESQVDGTLKYRFSRAGLKHPVIAKTGTHEFSSSLSGKIVREGRRNILFSIHIFNHPFSVEESVEKVLPVIDRIVALLDQQF